MLKKLLVERFKSYSGSEYIYDGITGTVIPSNKVINDSIEIYANHDEDYTIKELSKKYNESQVKSAIKFLSRWEKNFDGIYINDEESCFKNDFDATEIENYLNSGGIFLLVLNMTEDCNFRCKYCYLSEVYENTRNRSNKHMSLETGKKAIDLYFEYINSIEKSVPAKQAGITFYGGEPLLNFKILKELVEYAEEKTKVPVLFNMTTNGYMLNDEVVDFIVRHNINVGISIDGAESNHDKNRILSGGKGTFEVVYKNLRRFKERYPEYFRIGIFSVYDINTNFYENKEFFETEELPPIFLCNQVLSENTDYYKKFTKEEIDGFNKSLKELMSVYIEKKQNNENPPEYLRALFEGLMNNIIMRKRHLDSNPSFLPYTGTCVPGSKISVRVDGKIDMCERINSKFPIGDICNGINYDSIKEIVNSYNNTIMKKCRVCTVSKMCPVCFASCARESGFSLKKDFCKEWKKTVVGMLSIIYTILEKNPMAFDHIYENISKTFEFKF